MKQSYFPNLYDISKFLESFIFVCLLVLLLFVLVWFDLGFPRLSFSVYRMDVLEFAL